MEENMDNEEIQPFPRTFDQRERNLPVKALGYVGFRGAIKKKNHGKESSRRLTLFEKAPDNLFTLTTQGGGKTEGVR